MLQTCHLVKECMLSSSSCSTLNTWKVDTRSWYFERIHLINDVLDKYLDIWICIRYTISRYKTLTVIWLKSVCWAHHVAPPWTLSQQINQFLNQTLWPSSSSLGGFRQWEEVLNFPYANAMMQIVFAGEICLFKTYFSS